MGGGLDKIRSRMAKRSDICLIVRVFAVYDGRLPLEILTT